MIVFLRAAINVLVPIFVVTTMLSVGLGQRLSDILQHLGEWPFVVRLVVANFVMAPLLMMAIVSLLSLEPAIAAGLFIFSLGAGAPFLIKLTRAARHDIALGTAAMLVLMVLTVGYIPLVLPRLADQLATDPWAIARTLLLLMIVPLVLGMLFARAAYDVAARLQPWLARIASYALYGILAATVVGYFPQLLRMAGAGALATVLFVLGAFGFGWLAGRGKQHHEHIGALATAQRNTAAGLIVATQNFENRDVLVVISLASAIGLVLLLLIARYLGRNAKPGAASQPT